MIRAAEQPRRGKGQADMPYTMKLADGRTLYVEVPGRWTAVDRGGQVALTPDGIRFLDRLRALAIRLDRAPSPGYIVSLRQALGWTQQQMAGRIGVSKLTVSRWERGTLRPGEDSIRALDKVRRQTAGKGVVLGG